MFGIEVPAKAHNGRMNSVKANRKRSQAASESSDVAAPRAPRNDEERQVYKDVMEAIEEDEWVEYSSVDEMIQDLEKKAASISK